MSNQSYKVYGLSGTFFAQNERTGVIDITDSNFFNVLQYAIISSDNVIITGNISHENGNGSNGSCGYYIQDCNHVSCYSNKTFNEGIGSNNNGSGFLLYNINKSVIIQGNEIYDNQTTRTMNIGINALNSMTDCNAIYNYISPSIPYLVFQASYFTNVLGNIT